MACIVLDLGHGWQGNGTLAFSTTTPAAAVVVVQANELLCIHKDDHGVNSAPIRPFAPEIRYERERRRCCWKEWLTEVEYDKNVRWKGLGRRTDRWTDYKAPSCESQLLLWLLI